MDEHLHDHSTQEWRRLQALRLRESVVTAMQRARAERLNESLRSFAIAKRDVHEQANTAPTP